MTAARSISNRKLSNRVFASIATFTIFIILAISLALLSIFYYTYEHSEESRLMEICTQLSAYADSAFDMSDNQNKFVRQLEKHFNTINKNEPIRFSLIRGDGVVLFDSATDAKKLDNHLKRPEVQAALKSGSAVSTRISNTLGSDTLYVATKLENGSILRLSENRETFIAFMGNMLMPIIIAFVAAIALALVVSRQITWRIVRPLHYLDLSKPLDNEMYAELMPLLNRIDDQQKHLQEQNTKLSEADNMRREFSANVSHELKTPLQVISGYTELMKEGMVPPEDVKKFSEIIFSEANDMRRLVDEVLTLSKLDEPTRSKELFRIDLFATTQNAYRRLESFAKDCGVEVCISGDHAIIQGNETLLEGMMHNLIENGIRYNNAGGHVNVKIAEQISGGNFASDSNAFGCDATGQAASTHQPAASDHCAIITVADDGIGIPANMQEQVFERFFRVDKSRNKETGGTGLGLAIVKHTVAYHGGSIKLRSVEGKGSTFTIVLPLEEQQSAS